MGGSRAEPANQLEGARQDGRQHRLLRPRHQPVLPFVAGPWDVLVRPRSRPDHARARIRQEPLPRGAPAARGTGRDAAAEARGHHRAVSWRDLLRRRQRAAALLRGVTVARATRVIASSILLAGVFVGGSSFGFPSAARATRHLTATTPAGRVVIARGDGSGRRVLGTGWTSFVSP